MNDKITIQPTPEKLGVLLPGMGAVATTFIAGVYAIIQNDAKPVGSLTQMGTIRLGKRTEHRSPKIKNFVPLASLESLVFGGWDIYSENLYDAATTAGVLRPETLNPIREQLEAITPMPAVFDNAFVRNLSGTHIKTGDRNWDLANQLREDIRQFKTNHDLERLVMVWCGSTEVYIDLTEAHISIEGFEQAMKDNDPSISPSMMYAWAALKEGVPYANGAPNLSVDIPALKALSIQQEVPICGKDFKTGQTMMKTIIAPGLKSRMLGISGWFSTNILGNRDGEVLDDPDSFKTKEVSKLSVLDTILQPEINRDLYGNMYHKVRIDYYPPRGDNKEGWDNIDIFGWLEYPMQIKVNFLCRDSILAAPIVLDLALFMDLAQRAGMSGIQEWLSFYFKSPMVAEGLYPEHDLFIQLKKLKNTLRYMMGENLITHLGREYYE